MILLRYLYVLALVVWLGGMIVLGAVVAPLTFQVLQAQEPATGRALAGAVFGAVLARFHIVAYVAGGVLLATLAVMALLGPRPTAFAIRTAIAGAMLAVALYSGVVIAGRIERLQRDIGTPVSALREDDPRRVRFGRLHGLSTTLMLVNVVGGLALVFLEIGEP
jgi:uncharacterized membrane protein